MPKASDIRVRGAKLFFLPVRTRIPLKFGSETLTEVTCARVCIRVITRQGESGEGWGETPLSVQWVWPSQLAYQRRLERLRSFCVALAGAWTEFDDCGHPIEIGYFFQQSVLPTLMAEHNRRYPGEEAMPWLAALVCCSAFDLAIHDAYGCAFGLDVYKTYNARFLSRDLAELIQPAAQSGVTFENKFPADYLVTVPPTHLPAWHLVGGLDLLDAGELTGREIADGHPILLPDWIRRDGLKCLKIKLRGNDDGWDYRRVVRVGEIAIAEGVSWLSVDFNCTVTNPVYVTAMLDQLARDQRSIHERILYVEQPFPYELEHLRLDVSSVAARKPLFLDESAHDWRFVRLGRELGWTGVALKTCKTQTGALLSCAWAKAHGMALMVQDLSNPMLAQIPHLRLAAHVGTIMGVETNGMQFYPEASRVEATVHPGMYRRRDGQVDLSTLGGPGFGYRLSEMARVLPEVAVVCGDCG